MNTVSHHPIIKLINHPICRLLCICFLFYAVVPKTAAGLVLCAAATVLTVGAYFLLNKKGFFTDQQMLHCKIDWILSIAIAFSLVFVLFRKQKDKTIFAAVPFFTLAIHSVLIFLNGLRNRSEFFRILICAGAAVVPAAISYFQFQFSSLGNLQGFILHSSPKMLVNITCVCILYLLMICCTRRFRSGMCVAAILCCIWATVNYYVILYHGSPLFLSELRNTRTALQVLSGYSLTISAVSLVLFGSTVFSLIVILWALPPVKLGYKTTAVSAVSMLIAMTAVGCFWGMRSSDFFDWSWKEGITSSGYFLCLFQDAHRMMNPYSEPKGYITVEETASAPRQDTPDPLPDIIFILNESLCDLNDVLGIKTDTDYTRIFYSIDNSVTGRAVAPSVGGGTNNSEFEFLTSKSMFIMPASAPFNYVDFQKAGSSIVSYLKQYGYYTTAMHCRNELNYSRNIAYPAMGFDRLILGEKHFTSSYYNSRRWLDEDNYRDMFAYYEDNRANTSAPQFLYLLTFQNHGGYSINAPECDTIHADINGSDLNEQVNEYMTSISMSFQAFEMVIDYFSQQDRPVIVCMVGDHTPSFIDELTGIFPNVSGDAKEIAERTVPYIIWSNYGLDFSGFADSVSMVDLAPMVVSSAGLDVTPFYQKILDVQREFPVRTSNGILMEPSGELSHYDDADEKYRSLAEYYSIEYDSLAVNQNYNPDYFLPQIQK